MITTKKELVKILQGNRDKILSLGVARIGLFGSFARDNANDKSDIDFMVEFQEGKKNYNNFFDLHEKLQAIVNRKIDLVTKESLSVYLSPYILKEVEYVI
jgi:hypothetical protein